MKAIEHYKKILISKNQGRGFSPPISALVGRIYAKIGERDLAIAFFEQAIKDNPSNSSLYNEIAELHLKNNDTLSAIQNLNNSLTQQRFQRDPYLTLFFLHINKDNFDIANKIINESYQFNANDFGTLYCYGLTQKFILNSQSGDSILSSVKENAGINKRMEQLIDFKNFGSYVINGRTLNQQESRFQLIKDAIEAYPYYDGFYKRIIQYTIDNKLSNDISIYKKKYLFYSKFNPDSIFISKYF